MSDPTLIGQLRLSGPHHLPTTFAFRPVTTTTPPTTDSTPDYAAIEPHLPRTVEAMRLYGGGFISALATALARADGSNRRKLLAAFGDQISAYGPGSRFFDVTPA
jgi:hypothetical protein